MKRTKHATPKWTDAVRTAFECDEEPSVSPSWTMKETIVSHYLALHRNDPVVAGLVHGNEIRAAMIFEYARANETLRRAAAKYRSWITRVSKLPKKLRREPFSYFCQDPEWASVAWIAQDPWAEIWQTRSFPKAHWLELDEKEKAPILTYLSVEDRAAQPLPVNDVRLLQSLGVLDRFAEMARQPGNNRLGSRPARFTDARGFEHVLVTVAPDESGTTAGDRFKVLLNRSDARGKNKGINREKVALRDLATLWLVTTMTPQQALEWTAAHHVRVNGRALPYYQGRAPQTAKPTQEEADTQALYADHSALSKAAAHARETYRELFPFWVPRDFTK